MSKYKDMSFLDHLEELRWHLIRSVISILIFGFIAFLAKEIIFDIIIFGPKKGDFISYKLFCSISQSFGGDAFCFGCGFGFSTGGVSVPFGLPVSKGNCPC